MIVTITSIGVAFVVSVHKVARIKKLFNGSLHKPRQDSYYDNVYSPLKAC